MLTIALGIAACAEQPAGPSQQPPASLAAQMTADVADGSYLVRTSGNRFPAGFAAKVAALGGSVTFAHESGIGAVSGLTPAAAAELATLAGVAAVDDDDFIVVEQTDMLLTEAADVTVASPDLPGTAVLFPRQWNMRQIEADVAWAAGRLGEPTTKVGIIDTGLGYTHLDLVGRVDLVLSKSFVPADDARVQANFPGAHPVADLRGHGTHVGATVTSNAVAAAGVTSGLTLVGLKVCDVFGACPTSAILEAILYAVDNNLPVVNISLAGGYQRRELSGAGGTGPSFIATINSVFNYAYRKGTTVVVAAGNGVVDMDHDRNGYQTFCSAPHVICVSATGPTAQESPTGPWTAPDTPAPYTNFGRSAISVAAPGGVGAAAVFSACSRFSLANPACRAAVLATAQNGTSSAAPHVAALAALISEDVGHNPAKIRARLQQSADDLGAPGTDPYYGKGRINVRKALGL
jgi:hypothetical protein